MYEEGAFIDAHGLASDAVPPGPLPRAEAAVQAMLGPFWRALQAVLAEQELVRFGSLLTRLSDPVLLDRIASSLPVHLLVDEFQDTSLS